MKKAIIILCLLVVSASNLRSQQSAGSFSGTVDSGYSSVEGEKLFYEMAGEGADIVLLHDGLVHREVWDGQFRELAKNFRVMRYDRRGYGKSSNPKVPFSNIEDLNQLFIQLKIDSAIVCGMSAGGGIAIDFCLRYPKKVTALVLVGAVVSGYGYSSHMLSRGGRISLEQLLADPKKFIAYFGSEDPYTISSENIQAREKFLRLLEANPINVTIDKFKFQKPRDRLAVKFLSEINVPTLVLVGEHDIPDVHAHSGVIEVGIPNAKREVISKAGHLVPLEQPEAFNAAVLTFFKEHGIL
jgi:pimeloyl-ACP methyl ester carboxylesterase